MGRRNNRQIHILVERPGKGKRRGRNETEWLPGSTDAEDFESEADALLRDPRDTIQRVYEYKLNPEQFGRAITKEDVNGDTEGNDGEAS